MNLKRQIAIMVLATLAFIENAFAAVNFTALTDLITAVFDVLDVIVGRQDTLISVIILGAVLGMVGIVVYGFIAKLLVKIGDMGVLKK